MLWPFRRVAQLQRFGNSGSFAMLMALRRASSLVSRQR